MPPPLRYSERLLIRLRPGTRERIAALQAKGEDLADTQRRVIESGLDALEGGMSHKSPHNRSRPVKPLSGRLPMSGDTPSPGTTAALALLREIEKRPHPSVEVMEAVSHPPGLMGVLRADAVLVASLVEEVIRLRRATDYARARMKQPAYVERMDKIVSGELDAEHANPDFTQMTGGHRG